MKKLIFLISLIMILGSNLFAQSDYKVVFDLTSRDSLDQRAVTRWINEIITIHPEARLEVVMYAQGVNLAVKGKSNYETKVSEFLSNKNINFSVCGIALKNLGIATSELLPGVKVVPDGIYEIISKQHEGWGYIKVTH